MSNLRFLTFGQLPIFREQFQLIADGRIPFCLQHLGFFGNEVEALVVHDGDLFPMGPEVLENCEEVPVWSTVPSQSLLKPGWVQPDVMAPEASRTLIERNSPPLKVRPGTLFVALQNMETALNIAAAAAEKVRHGAGLVLAGYNFSALPLGIDESAWITPKPRYHVLNDVIPRYYGGPYWDQSVCGQPINMHSLAAAMGRIASFQPSLQVHPDQAVKYVQAGMACMPIFSLFALNAPIMDGRLVDLACVRQAHWDVWIGGGKEDLSKFGLGRWMPEGEGSLANYLREALWDLPCIFQPTEEELSKGPEHLSVVLLAMKQLWCPIRPPLRSTIGHDGNPLFSVVPEFRFLPSGPSTKDMVARMYGLFAGIEGVLKEFGSGTCLDYHVVKEDYQAVNRLGQRAEVSWFDGSRMPIMEAAEKFLTLIEIGGQSFGWSASEKHFCMRNLRSVLFRDDGERRLVPLNGANYARELWSELEKQGVPGDMIGRLISKHYSDWGLIAALSDWPSPKEAASQLR